MCIGFYRRKGAQVPLAQKDDLSLSNRATHLDRFLVVRVSKRVAADTQGAAG